MVVPRRIAVLTGSRSEYGLLYWTIRGIVEDPELELLLLVTGSHLSPKFGETVREIEEDGFPIAARIGAGAPLDTPNESTGSTVSAMIGATITQISGVLTDLKPDLLLILGDRWEVLAAATAALPQLVPVAHIHGGESSVGAIDESIRHAVTKLSHLHFASTEFYAKRIMQMGEETWRINVSGAPGIEYIYRTELSSKLELETELNLDLGKDTLMVTYHPETLSPENVAWAADELFSALEDTEMPMVITYPNADAGGQVIIDRINDFERHNPQVRVRANLGSRRYLGLLKHSSVMVGNSSSGIIEAASFGLPVVNIGDRQEGRIRGANVIDVTADRKAINLGIRSAMKSDFQRIAREAKNPYDNGRSSEVILDVLKSVELNQNLCRKRLVDLQISETLSSAVEQ